jgi:hypothetical protein
MTTDDFCFYLLIQTSQTGGTYFPLKYSLDQLFLEVESLVEEEKSFSGG